MKRLAAVAISMIALFVMSPTVASAGVPGKTFTETGCDGYSDSVARLYTAGLDREPEQGGFEYWMGEYTSGRWLLPSMAAFFAQSDEFERNYGELTQDGFIRQLYRNVLGREGESGGVIYWNGEMDAGMDRGTVLLRFAESRENIMISGTVEPILGPFNGGLSGPWTCTQPAPTPDNPGDSKTAETSPPRPRRRRGSTPTSRPTAMLPNSTSTTTVSHARACPAEPCSNASWPDRQLL